MEGWLKHCQLYSIHALFKEENNYNVSFCEIKFYYECSVPLVLDICLIIRSYVCCCCWFEGGGDLSKVYAIWSNIQAFKIGCYYAVLLEQYHYWEKHNEKCIITSKICIQNSTGIFILYIRIRIHLLASRNLLWDILRLPSSLRTALDLCVILTLWRGWGANQPPCALLHIGARCAMHCTTGDDDI